MLRVVLDTNILLRALINPKGPCGRLFSDYSHLYVLVVSPDIVREIIEVLRRPLIRRSFPQISEVSVADMLEQFARAEVVEPAVTVNASRDPKDNKFIACALAGRCQYLVSEDKDLTSLGSYHGVRIIGGREFLEIIRAE